MSTGERHERPPSDAELAAERARLEAVLERSGVSLGDPALWAEPPAHLERTIVAAAPSAEYPVPTRPRARFGRVAPIVAAAAVLVLVVGVVAAFLRSPGPDWQVTLRPTAEAPGATAVALGWNHESGTRIVLETEGLAESPDGFVYELWLSSDHAHISAGTFRSAEGAQLWVGVSRADFPRVWITLEPLDGDPNPAVNLLDTSA